MPTWKCRIVYWTHSQVSWCENRVCCGSLEELPAKFCRRFSYRSDFRLFGLPSPKLGRWVHTPLYIQTSSPLWKLGTYNDHEHGLRITGPCQDQEMSRLCRCSDCEVITCEESWMKWMVCWEEEEAVTVREKHGMASCGQSEELWGKKVYWSFSQPVQTSKSFCISFNKYPKMLLREAWVWMWEMMREMRYKVWCL